MTIASASAAPGLTTMGQTVVVGPPDPANGGCSRLQFGQGEPHVLRTDVTTVVAPVRFAITSFAQLTDLHVVDDQSPLRVEWLDRYANPRAAARGILPLLGRLPAQRMPVYTGG